jgi:hypothetical protein
MVVISTLWMVSIVVVGRANFGHFAQTAVIITVAVLEQTSPN